MRACVLLCLVVQAGVLPAAAEDFHQWRGPQRNGAVPDSPPLAAGWGEKAVPLDVLERLATVKDQPFPTAEDLEKWLGANHIAGDLKKTVLRAIPTRVERSWDTIYCFGIADGKTMWKARYDGAPGGRSASSTPCVVSGRCYAAGSDGMVYCLDAETGREAWKARPQEKGGTVHSSPLVAEGAVVILAGHLTALDAAKGTVRWRQPKVSGHENSPVSWSSGGKAFVICNTGRSVACVSLADGAIAWEAPGGGRSSAAVAGDLG
jgi:outer membrane protein assembly factor BamB